MWRFQPVGELRNGAEYQLVIDEIEPWTNSRRARDPVDPWISRCCFDAACHCNKCTTAYHLEKSFRAARGEAKSGWYDESTMRWPLLRRGQLHARRRVEAADQGVVERLKFGEGDDALPWLVVNASFWRGITPQRLDVAETVDVVQGCNADKRPPITELGREGATFAEFVRAVSAGLDEPGARCVMALSRLWAYMRRAQGPDGLLVYLACYLAWRNARSALRADPIFGSVIDEIYAYTSRHFGRLVIAPCDRSSLDLLVRELGIRGVSASSCGGRVVLNVGFAAPQQPSGSQSRQWSALRHSLNVLLSGSAFS